MKVYCTYCSSAKDHSKGLLPAIERYRSERIRSIHAEARKAKIPFFILSGKYGLLQADTPIPDYDHLLQPSEAQRHSTFVADRLKELGVTSLSFFHRPVADDANIRAYLNCIGEAGRLAGVAVEFIEL